MNIYTSLFIVQVETKKHTRKHTTRKNRKETQNTYLTINRIIKQLTYQRQSYDDQGEQIIVAARNYTCQVAQDIINDN